MPQALKPCVSSSLGEFLFLIFCLLFSGVIRIFSRLLSCIVYLSVARRCVTAKAQGVPSSAGGGGRGARWTWHSLSRPLLQSASEAVWERSSCIQSFIVWRTWIRTSRIECSRRPFEWFHDASAQNKGATTTTKSDARRSVTRTAMSRWTATGLWIRSGSFSNFQVHVKWGRKHLQESSGWVYTPYGL